MRESKNWDMEELGEDTKVGKVGVCRRPIVSL